MARTDWRYDDIVTENDMNEIGKEINSNTESNQKLSEEISRPEHSAPQTAVSSVISLDNTLDGKLNYTIKGRTYTNIVENGDFKDGTSGWLDRNATISAGTSVLSITGNGGSSNAQTLQILKQYGTPGKRYFIRFRARVTNAAANSIALMIFDQAGGFFAPGPILINSPVSGQWYTSYSISTIPSDFGIPSLYLRHSYPDATTANGKTMEVQEVMALDLDQYPDLQGLTAEEINAQIPNYIDGMQSVENVKMASVGKNLFDRVNAFENNALAWIQGTLSGENLSLASDFMAIEESKQYYTNFKASVHFYDGNKKYIGALQSGGISVSPTTGVPFSSFIVPSGLNIVYLRLAFRAPFNGNEDMNKKNIQLEQGTTPTSYEPYKESTMYLPIPLRQLPNGVSDTLDNEGNYVRRTEEYVLKGGDISSIYTTDTHIDAVLISLSTIQKMKGYGSNDFLAKKLSTSVTIPFNNNNPADQITNAWRHRINVSNWAIIVPKGTYANLIEAQTALAGTRVIYELAEPITQKLNIPPVTSFKDGTLMFENKRKYILQADDVISISTSLVNVDLAHYPLSILKSCRPVRTTFSDNYIFDVKGKLPCYTYTNADRVSEIGKWYVNQNGHMYFILPKGTTLAQAKEQLAGLEIEYETIPFPLPEVEYSYPVNLAASVQGNTEMVAQLSREVGDLWFTLLPLADKELAMGLVVPLTTETTADLKSKINQILDIWT